MTCQTLLRSNLWNVNVSKIKKKLHYKKYPNDSEFLRKIDNRKETMNINYICIFVCSKHDVFSKCTKFIKMVLRILKKSLLNFFLKVL